MGKFLVTLHTNTIVRDLIFSGLIFFTLLLVISFISYEVLERSESLRPMYYQQNKITLFFLHYSSIILFIIMAILNFLIIILETHWICPNCYSLFSIKKDEPELIDEWEEGEEKLLEREYGRTLVFSKYKVKKYKQRYYCNKCNFNEYHIYRNYDLIDRKYHELDS